jgi:hypothetical protein
MSSLALAHSCSDARFDLSAVKQVSGQMSDCERLAVSQLPATMPGTGVPMFSPQCYWCHNACKALFGNICSCGFLDVIWGCSVANAKVV